MSTITYEIAYTLSGQEQEGIIVTALSCAYHALLADVPNASYSVTQELLQSNVPSQAAYRKLTFSVSQGERLQISDLAALLVKRGYSRHSSKIADPGFFVQGDEITIIHPLINGAITISFLGSTVDRIVQQKERKKEILLTTTIFPLAFPTDQVLLSSILKNYTLIKKPVVKIPTTSPVSVERALELIGRLVPGKPAVHADHGIGIFEGLERRTIGTAESEYLIIRYKGGDSIAVPVPFAHKVSPYIGESSPAIYALGGTLWSKTKRKAQADAAAFAKELLEIAKQRKAATRPSYYIHPETELKLESSFGFELTPDQKQVWEEVKNDMTLPTPMDRLIVGDVGFGKTELAIRAAMHAFSNGKQVALLAPTTLLVQQHVDTFRTRLPDIADFIFLISRFSSKKEIARAKKALSDNKPAIVIGTHGLLSSSVPWTNLGLLIIDEEQRFGVSQKEHPKKMRATIDILSLSATPIPRTLSMALSGLRSLSIIATAPQGRKDIETIVQKENNEIIKHAIEQELARNGQVYVVSPKIRNLAMIQEIILGLLPNAKTAIAHAQLPDETLSHIIHEFDTKKVDILISSSIIENGLDLPNVNTMIIWNAAHFGLGQLYQLRGRIGRRSRQGYAYLLYSQDKLTPLQRLRLTALTEASRVGSGWDIARRDLEMRGAGNMLSAAQSGSAHEVGMQLYLDMVDGRAEEVKASIHILLPAFIPSSYIENPDDRTAWYVRLSRAKDLQDITTKKLLMQETYGQFPQEVENIIRMISLELLATKQGITKITSSTISPSDEDPYAKIEIVAKDPVKILQKLSNIKNKNNSPSIWQVRNTTLSWSTDAITPELIDEFIFVLQ
ncbi:MAG: helicase-related protein [bacterium]|nr:helicase-related protein [bacterium]